MNLLADICATTYPIACKTIPDDKRSSFLPPPPSLPAALEPAVGEPRPVKTAEEAEPELRRRRSLLAALERIGRTEEEEEKEEDFRFPQREEDSGFSVNKCILGAVILLGLGTIFFSGRHRAGLKVEMSFSC